MHNKTTAAIVWAIGLLFLIFYPFPVVADNNITTLVSDTTGITLDEIEITSQTRTPLRRGGSVELSQSDLTEGVHLLGVADALNRLKTTGGVSSISSYGSGIIVDGFDPSQTLFRINGTPVFYPYRFGGMFSNFNTSHFNKIDFERGFHGASMPSRLGAKVDFQTSVYIPDSPSATIDAGMISSSAALKVPFKEIGYVSAAGRISYIDELYGWLYKNSMDLKYRFYDLNFSSLFKLGERDILTLDGFLSSDNLKYNDSDYAMDNILLWRNQLLSQQWRHQGRMSHVQRIFYSGFSNKFDIRMPQMTISIPTFVRNIGIAGEFEQWLRESTIKLNYGYEGNLYFSQYNKTTVDGFGRISQQKGVTGNAKPWEVRVYGDMMFPLGDDLRLYAGFSTSYYRNGSTYHSVSLDPRLTLNIPVGNGSFSFHLGRYSQTLHNVGFSQIGLASDFWIPANREIPIQSQVSLEGDYTGLLRGALYYSINIYGRRMIAQPEYEGTIIHLLDNNYDPHDYINVYNGYNYGVNFNLKKTEGKITGEIGMGYGRAIRNNSVNRKFINGRTDPGFSLNLQIGYRPDRHWVLGAQFKFSQGRRYTPVAALYMIGENILTEYGEPNSRRFPPVHQLDLSAGWGTISKVGKVILNHFINLSIINAYGRNNTEIMSYYFDYEKGVVKLKKVYSLYKFLPSLSYTLKF